MSNIISSAIVANIKQGTKEHFDAALDKWLYQQGWPVDLPITEADREAAQQERQKRVKQIAEQERLDHEARRRKQREEIDRLAKEDADRLEQERSPDYQGLSRKDYQAVMKFYDDDERDHRHLEAGSWARLKAGEFSWRKPKGETKDDPNDDPPRDEPENRQTGNRHARRSPWGSVKSPSGFAPVHNRGNCRRPATWSRG